MSQAAIILFVSLVVFLILNVPVGIAIGLASLCVVFNSSRLSDSFMVQQLITGTDSFPIMAIPLFILAGELMAAGGVSKRILNVCSAYFGHITGGLAIVTVVVCMFFAAVSGSGPATVAAVGAMVVPAMLEKGYSKSFTLACIACSGCIGVIIPPSIPMVIYGVSTTTSITGMFMAGFLPGIFIGLCLCLLCYFYCKKMGWKGDDKRYTSKERLAIIWDAKWALIDPIIILGGIYGGIFTPTEAAAVAAVYAFICGVFIYRELTPKQLFNTIASACSTNGTTMAIIGAATAFTRILTIEQIPAMITQAILYAIAAAVVIWLGVALAVASRDDGALPDSAAGCAVSWPECNSLRYHHGCEPGHRLHHAAARHQPLCRGPCRQHFVGDCLQRHHYFHHRDALLPALHYLYPSYFGDPSQARRHACVSAFGGREHENLRYPYLSGASPLGLCRD